MANRLLSECVVWYVYAVNLTAVTPYHKTHINTRSTSIAWKYFIGIHEAWEGIVLADMVFSCKEVFCNVIRYFKIWNVQRIVQNLNVINHMLNNN